MSIDEAISFFIGHIEVIYNPQSTNDVRRQSIQILDDAQDAFFRKNQSQKGVECNNRAAITPAQLVQVGLSILQNEALEPACRAFGATIMSRAVQKVATSPFSNKDIPTVSEICVGVPVLDIVNWIADADASTNLYDDWFSHGNKMNLSATEIRVCPLPKIITGLCSSLIASCALYIWPNEAQGLLDTLCPETVARTSTSAQTTGLASLPSIQRALLDFCRLCCEPPFAKIPKSQIAALRQGIIQSSPIIVQRVTQCLLIQYNFILSCIEPSTPCAITLSPVGTTILQKVCEDMEVCLEILGIVAGSLSPMIPQWWSLGINTDLVNSLMSLANYTVNGKIDQTGEYGRSPFTVSCAVAELCSLMIMNISNDNLNREIMKYVPRAPEKEPDAAQSMGMLINFVLAPLDPLDSLVLEPRRGVNPLIEKLHQYIVSNSNVFDSIHLVAEEMIIAGSPSLLDKYIYFSQSSMNIKGILIAKCVNLLKVPSIPIVTGVCCTLVTQVTHLIHFVDRCKDNEKLSATPSKHLSANIPFIPLDQLRKVVFPAFLDANELMSTILPYCSRNFFDPRIQPEALISPAVLNSTPMGKQANLDILREAKDLATEYFSDVEYFNISYGEMRNHAATLLPIVAFLFPEMAHVLLQYLLCGGPSGFLAQPLETERRTDTGNVTQHGEAYARWSTAEYLIGLMLEPCHRSPLWEGGNDAASGSFQTLMSSLRDMNLHLRREGFPDATLAPVFLNIWHHFWRIAFETYTPGATNIKKSTHQSSFSHLLLVPPPIQTTHHSYCRSELLHECVQILFHGMNLTVRVRIGNYGKQMIAEDPDLLSARKRACTLLISVCADYGKLISQAPGASGFIITQVQKMCINEKILPSERSFLHEALAVLSANEQDPDAQSRYLNNVITTPLNLIKELIPTMTTNRLAQLFVGKEKNDRSVWYELKDAIATLVSIQRRLAPTGTEYAYILNKELVPLLGSLALCMHQMSDSDFPPDFAGILDPVDDELKARSARCSGNRQAVDVIKNSKEMARKTLSWIRATIYQGIGESCNFPDTAVLEKVVPILLTNCEHFVAITMKDLCNFCLFRLATRVPALAERVLSRVGDFFEARRQVRVRNLQQMGGVSLSTDVVEVQHMYFFSRDTVSFLKTVAVDGGLYRCTISSKDNGIGSQEHHSGRELGRTGSGPSIVAPSEATFPCLSDVSAFNVFINSLETLLVHGFDLNAAANLGLMVLNSGQMKGNNESSLPIGINRQESAIKLFALIVVGTMVNPNVDRIYIREKIIGLLSDIYMEAFPDFQASFTTSYDFVQRYCPSTPGYEAPKNGLRTSLLLSTSAGGPEELEAMHALLMSARGKAAHKRNIFVDMVFSIFGMHRCQSETGGRGGGHNGERGGR